MCVTSRYISLAKCISPDDALTILLEYQSTRFLIASCYLNGSMICTRRQAFTTISLHSRLSCRLRPRAFPFRSFFSLFSSGFGIVFCFFVSGSRRPWTSRIVNSLFHSFFFHLFCEKERSLNPPVICHDKTLEYF